VTAFRGQSRARGGARRGRRPARRRFSVHLPFKLSLALGWGRAAVGVGTARQPGLRRLHVGTHRHGTRRVALGTD